jgi:hypothetical protein
VIDGYRTSGRDRIAVNGPGPCGPEREKNDAVGKGNERKATETNGKKERNGKMPP